MDAAKVVAEHDSAMQELRAVMAESTVAPPLTQDQRNAHGLELAKLVVQLCENGGLKSRRRLAMAKALLADAS